MLNLLRISGFALIDEVEISLGPGLTVITGETGAGKSILVEALGLLRGGRASTELIRTGRDEAQVEAVLVMATDDERHLRLTADGRDLSDGLVVRRVLSQKGRGRVYLGGTLATAGELAAHVGSLVDITSQHDQQSLMDPDSQLAIVDVFADNHDRLAAMKAAYESWRQADEDLRRFEADARTRAEREDLLRFQIAELEEVDPRPGELDGLRTEREKVKGAERFAAMATRGEDVLYAGEVTAAAQITLVLRDLEPLAALDPALAPVAERLGEARALVEEVARDLARYGSQIRFEPGRLEEIEERLFALGRLARKHGGTLEAAIARRDEMAAELGALGSYEESLQARRDAVARARAEADAVAADLGDRRGKMAKKLGARIDETLKDLGLGGAHVAIEVESRPAGEPPGASGRDRVRFLFAPNPGEPPRPLARIASGGELSRVMLAVKRALAAADRALTYVFDEVDSGVGGAVAEVIGRKLKAVSEERQVLAVTHLPQIAAFADQHLKVEKSSRKGRTTVTVRVLDEAERQQELARMVGGLEPSRQASAHASEMLRRARALSSPAAQS
jgi:DNA repair protein RecN (Recombination protein N)